MHMLDTIAHELEEPYECQRNGCDCWASQDETRGMVWGGGHGMGNNWGYHGGEGFSMGVWNGVEQHSVGVGKHRTGAHMVGVMQGG